MRKLNVIWICGIVAACSNSPTSPSAISSGGDGSARVGLLGAPPSSQIGPGAGTGTAPPTVGVPNSCPTDKPVVSVNGNNGKHDFAITRVAGQTRSYAWELERENAGRYQPFLKLSSDVNDGRQGLYAQPPTLKGGMYRVRARAVRVGCGAKDLGTWSDYQPFSVHEFSEDAGSVNPTPAPAE